MKNQVLRCCVRYALAATLSVVSQSLFSADGPIDPFDYNFCGGERVYPIVGVNFATYCGPRNQVALGRRGKLMWFYPQQKGQPGKTGRIKLTDAQLTKLSLLAEVSKITVTPPPTAQRVMVRMGINFSGRKPAYIHSGLVNSYSPSNELMLQMLALVPDTDTPYLPDCTQPLVVFDPTDNRQEHIDKINSDNVIGMKNK